MPTPIPKPIHSSPISQHNSGYSRREWIRIGGLSSLGLGMSQLLGNRGIGAHSGSIASNGSGAFGRAKSCIVLFMLGGPPQHETWDPKPDAPVEVRGDLGWIESVTPGFRVGELMPQTAKWTNHIACLRATATDDNAHSSSGYWMLTGRPHAPKNFENALPGAPNDWPCVGSVVRHLRGDTHRLPASIRLPEEIWNTGHIVWPGQDAGWLGDSADPWLLTCDPNQANFRAGEISLPMDISRERFHQRRALLQQMNLQLDQHRNALEQNPGTRSRWSGLQKQAVDLLQASEVAEAFAIDRESEAMRERYGRNRFGQSVLLARRLVESGVSLVQVNWARWEKDPDNAPAWDTHVGNADRLKNHLMPAMDQAYSALLEDLFQRGMLEETLVVWMGEFGRSPKINPSAGRDHWGHVFSTALAGGGIRGGIVHGKSDRQGGFPIEGRIEPQDLSATIFHCLGIDPQTEIRDRVGRPSAVSKGRPIEEILI